ncbi:copper chaperone PCu(A)C [Deinococcus sp. SL84]|uniref:copper chaperone PCu(A)C n=1 Tax=Deinococcus sp. SL84 TaxID=2994663 RepID=UPI0022757578|nr:copper chaperone PCu(A)C [Deinococcus sp. SL84]MCY1703351.1 copper chaperone PCu(A)C [Deinococcus sp. SL84]
MTTGSMIPHPARPARRRSVLLPLLLLPGLLVGCQAPTQETSTSTSSQMSQGSQVTTSETSTPQDSASEASTAHTSTDASAHAGHDMASAATASASAAAEADSAGALPLEVKAATVTAVPPGLTDTAAYITLHNPTDADIVLVGAATPAAGHAMLMQTVTTDASGTSMSGMVEVPSLTVPAGGELSMSSAGDHVMLMGLTGALKEGSSLPLTLEAEDGRTLNLSAEVQRP